MCYFNRKELETWLQKKEIVDSQKRLFKIDLVYKEHVDVAKEALVRMYINDKYYRRQLQSSLAYLFPN